MAHSAAEIARQKQRKSRPGGVAVPPALAGFRLLSARGILFFNAINEILPAGPAFLILGLIPMSEWECANL